MTNVGRDYKGWYSIPETVKLHPFTPGYFLYNFDGHLFDASKGGKYLEIKRIKALGVSLPLVYTAVKCASPRNKDGSPLLGVCMLTGKIAHSQRLKWRRVYNKKVYCVDPREHGYVWLYDKQQWVLKNDKRIALHKIKGETVKYATDPDWIMANYDCVLSPIEPGFIIRRNAHLVRTQDSETNMYISKYERIAQEYATYYHCDVCDVYFTADLRVHDTLCSHCANRTVGRTRSETYNYSHRVERDLGFDDTDCIFIGGVKQGSASGTRVHKGDALFLGAELEFVVSPDDEARAVRWINKSRYALCKRDASISLGGFEVVTKPCSPITHKKALTEMFKRFKDELHPHTDCGLHVHVSRLFSNGDIGKIIHFLNREENRDFVVGLARRENHTYAKFSENPISTAIQSKTIDVLGKRSGTYLMSTDRRVALNVKENTLEFRLFASSNDLLTVMANIQFCEAICMYAYEVKSLPINEWADVKNFIDYLRRVEYKGELIPGKGYTKSLRYADLLEYIAVNKLPIQSSNREYVLAKKVVKTLGERLIRVPKHMEIPASVAVTLANKLVKDKEKLRKWLNDPASIVVWKKDAWCLADYTGRVFVRAA